MAEKRLLEPSTYLFPAPCVVVSCAAGGETNLITLAWAGTLCSEPPQVGIGVRRSRHSHGLLVSGGDFVINIPAEDQARAVDFCGVRSGREVNKWEATGLKAAPAEKVAAPLIDEFPVNLECVIRRTLELGSHDLFIGEIVAVRVDEAVVGPDGRIDDKRIKPLVYSFGGRYRGLGSLAGTAGFSVKGQ
jgi:flavin reductase (DIM6/NTAB) family NADH-FMN oxidoreductase RutF